jgi:transposase
LSKDKPPKTVGLPIVPFRKVLDGVLYILRIGCQWKMHSREYGSGSTCHRRFQQWVELDVFKKMRIGLPKAYDGNKGIKWNSQSLDSISIKALLEGGDDRKQYH